VLCFDFDILDLGSMDAGDYVKTPNPAALALAARMRFTSKNRLSLIKDFAITLARIRTVKLVGDVVASFFFAYQHLDESEDLKLRQEIAKVESSEMRDRVMQLTNPWIEAGKREGFQQGRNEGRHEGEAELVLKQLARRLGALSAAQEKSIRKLPLTKIEELGEALLEFTSRADFVRWLRLNN